MSRKLRDGYISTEIRKRQVIDLFLKHKTSDGDIAMALDISKDRAQDIVYDLYREYGVTTRRALFLKLKGLPDLKK